MAPRRGREFWSGVIEAFEQSGLSHEQFAQQHRLNVGSFRGWLYRLRHEGGRGGRRKRGRSGALRVLPVRVQAAPIAASLIEVAVTGAVLRFTAGTDAEYVVDLVTRLRERC
jgi:hypothetical protein